MESPLGGKNFRNTEKKTTFQATLNENQRLVNRTQGMVPQEKLIKGCQEGRRKCQSQLYRQYASRMLGVCMRYTTDRASAEDILQDGFMKVFSNIGSFRGEGSLEGWIRRIMVNTALTAFKATRKQGFATDIDEMEDHLAQDDGAEGGDTEGIFNELQPDEIMELIRQLPEGYRMVLNLYVFEGATHKDIAEELGIAENTSKSQLSKARRFLRRRAELHLKEKQDIPILR